LKKCGSIRILQLFTTCVIVESLIYSEYYSVTAILNELCIPDIDTVVNKNILSVNNVPVVEHFKTSYWLIFTPLLALHLLWTHFGSNL